MRGTRASKYNGVNVQIYMYFEKIGTTTDWQSFTVKMMYKFSRAG